MKFKGVTLLNSEKIESVLTVDESNTVILSCSGEDFYYFTNVLKVSKNSFSTIIEFPGQKIFESDSHQLFNFLSQKIKPSSKKFPFHELLAPLIVLALAVFIISSGWITIKIIVPFASEKIAFAVPDKAVHLIGNTVLSGFTHESDQTELSTRESKHFNKLFLKVISQYDKNKQYKFRLKLIKGTDIGANAIAFPSGDIIVTDELISLIETDGQFEALIAHETGHVLERHGLRMIIQSSFLAITISFFTGDISFFASAGYSLSTYLLQNGYSRAFENEADRYAAEYCFKNNINIDEFAAFLTRLTENSPKINTGWLSTHPATSDRIKNIKRIYNLTETAISN